MPKFILLSCIVLRRRRLCALPDLIRVSRASSTRKGPVGQMLVAADAQRLGHVRRRLPCRAADRVARPLDEILAGRGGPAASEQFLYHESSID